jgi:hypothetical protein
MQIILLFSSMLIAGTAFGSSRVSGSLQSYIDIGVGGCDLGAASFSQFALALGQNGATPIKSIAGSSHSWRIAVRANPAIHARDDGGRSQPPRILPPAASFRADAHQSAIQENRTNSTFSRTRMARRLLALWSVMQRHPITFAEPYYQH